MQMAILQWVCWEYWGGCVGFGGPSPLIQIPGPNKLGEGETYGTGAHSFMKVFDEGFDLRTDLIPKYSGYF